jgi:hypothetical protein
MSSMRMKTTFGAPFGAFTSKRGGGVALRASSSVMVGVAGGTMGKEERSRSPETAACAGGLGLFSVLQAASVRAARMTTRRCFKVVCMRLAWRVMVD